MNCQTHVLINVVSKWIKAAPFSILLWKSVRFWKHSLLLIPFPLHYLHKGWHGGIFSQWMLHPLAGKSKLSPLTHVECSLILNSTYILHKVAVFDWCQAFFAEWIKSTASFFEIFKLLIHRCLQGVAGGSNTILKRSIYVTSWSRTTGWISM